MSAGNAQTPLQREEVSVSISHFPVPSAGGDSLLLQYDESRAQYLKYGLPLYKAAMGGDWEAAESIFKQASAWITAPITNRKETVLHVAATTNHLAFVTNLVELMTERGDNLESKTLYGNTAFSIVASSGNVDIARMMVKKNDQLPNIKGRARLTPLHMAILLGRRKMVDYLMEVTADRLLTDDDRIQLITSAIESDFYDVALHFIEKHRHLAWHRNSADETMLHVLAQKPMPTRTDNESMWKKIMRCTKWGKNEKDQYKLALELTRTTWNEVIKKPEREFINLIEKPTRVLLDAAKIGNADFLVILILTYPDVLWNVDKSTRSMFHFAVKYRQVEIFNLIYEIGAIKDFVASYVDKDQNNLLHLAAKIAPPDRLNCVSGAALQMQRELLWFEAVKEVIQPQYELARNIIKRSASHYDMEGSISFKTAPSDDDRSEAKEQQYNEDCYYYCTESENEEDLDKYGMTPQALFTKEHEKLRAQGEQWMIKTAESCTLVATLITTVVFTAAFTLPGGNDDKDGSPVLLRQIPFKIFAISNAVSLFASSTSILMFLSILTSRYAESDFLKVLPFKLMVGLTSLFVSIATMMLAFTTTFFITFQNDSIWIPAPIALLAVIPVLLFGFQQYPLLRDIFNSTYRSRTLFRPSDKPKLLWNHKRPKTKLC